MLVYHRTKERLTLLAITLCLLTTTVSGCAFMQKQHRDPNEPQSLTWDFSRGNDARNLDGYTLDVLKRRKISTTAYEDGIHLKLLLPNGKVLNEDLDTIFCTLRDGKFEEGKVEEIVVHFPTMTIDEIRQTGDRLIKYWDFDRGNFDDWCRERGGTIPEDDDRLGMDRNFKSRCRDDERPSLYMEILHYEGDRWSITWSVYWSSDKAE
jgi:hypothetical protein